MLQSKMSPLGVAVSSPNFTHTEPLMKNYTKQMRGTIAHIPDREILQGSQTLSLQ